MVPLPFRRVLADAADVVVVLGVDADGFRTVVDQGTAAQLRARGHLRGAQMDRDNAAAAPAENAEAGGAADDGDAAHGAESHGAAALALDAHDEHTATKAALAAKSASSSSAPTDTSVVDASGGSGAAVGRVPWRVYSSYLRAAGGRAAVLSVGLCALGDAGGRMASQRCLRRWTADTIGTAAAAYSRTLLAATSVVMVAVFARALCAAHFSRRAARATHARLLDATLAAPPAWLDRQPTGKLLQRFAGDMRAVDDCGHTQSANLTVTRRCEEAIFLPLDDVWCDCHPLRSTRSLRRR